MGNQIVNFCTLCALPVGGSSMRDGEHVFCCVGCQAVFNILSFRQELADFRENPVFKQALESGLISNPLLLEQIQRKQFRGDLKEIKRVVVEISDMWCPSCADLIRFILLQTKGVHRCTIDYTTDFGVVEYFPREIDEEVILKSIHSLGYQATHLESPDKQAVSFSLYLRFIVAAFCSLNLMMFAYPIYASHLTTDFEGYIPLLSWLSLGVSLPVLLYSAWPILQRFYHSLQMGVLGMETLVVLGVTAAFGISCYEIYEGTYQIYFDSMAVIITFILLGKIIETKAKFSAKASLLQLSKSLPRRGRRRNKDGISSFVPLKEISIGDQLVVYSGEKIVLDGVVKEGRGTCNEALMTGESLPVVKEIGDSVLGGAILQHGFLVIAVTADQKNSALGKIIDLVEGRIDHKTVYVRATDRIVQWFVPLVIAISLSTILFGWVFDVGSAQELILRGVSVLLIACPCAIGIAAPLAESHMIHALANRGVLIRNRGCLDLLGKETVFVFDKTGTITEGRFQVLAGYENLMPSIKQAVKSFTLLSTHPISKALAEFFDAPPLSVDKFEEFVGKGLHAVIGQSVYKLGSTVFFREHGIDIPEESITLQNPISTQVHLALNGRHLTTFSLGDKIRQEAADLLSVLKPARVILVSGDSEQAVESVSKVMSFDECYAECSPLQKREIIDRLRNNHEIVAFVGDGINDAPALTGAQIGISVMEATDISIQVSDILLATPQLRIISTMRMIALKGRRILKQNLFWAFFYNVIGLGLAALGMLTPIFAAFAMTMSSLVIIFNSKLDAYFQGRQGT
jgi:heavy metal translocating P-type ATPase